MDMNFNIHSEIPSADQGLEGTRLDTSIYDFFFVVPMSNNILKDVTAQCEETYRHWIPAQEHMRLI